MEVFSNPVCPMPMEYVARSIADSATVGHQQFQLEEKELGHDEFVQQFLSEIPGLVMSQNLRLDQQSNPQSMTCLQQPPEQPLFDSFPFEAYQGAVSPSSSSIVKQEEQSGFLATWGNQLPDDFDAMEIDQCTPEVRKRVHLSLVKEELHCKIKLKLIQEGKDIETEVMDNQPSAKEYEVSEETKVMQQRRKEKNREAAKKCRQKKRLTEQQQEMKIREAAKEIQHLKQQLAVVHRDFSSLLECLPNMQCCLSYLKRNRHLLANPTIKAALQKVVKNLRGSQVGGDHVACCLATQQVSQPTIGFSFGDM